MISFLRKFFQKTEKESTEKESVEDTPRAYVLWYDASEKLDEVVGVHYYTYLRNEEPNLPWTGNYRPENPLYGAWVVSGSEERGYYGTWFPLDKVMITTSKKAPLDFRGFSE